MGDAKIIHTLHRHAAQGESVANLVRLVLDKTRSKPDENGHYGGDFAVVTCFRSAFLISLKEARELAHWHGFIAGHLTDEELEEMFRSLILAHKNEWNSERTDDSQA